MTREEIANEWATFIEYPAGSDGKFVTTVSAKLFAEHISRLAAKAEREACAQVAGPDDSYQDDWFRAKADSVQRIRARGNP